MNKPTSQQANKPTSQQANKPQEQDLKIEGMNLPQEVIQRQDEILGVMQSKNVELVTLNKGMQEALPYYQKKYKDQAESIMGQALMNACLDDNERIAKAQELLPDLERDEQKEQAVIDAHNLGGDNAMVFTYSTVVKGRKLQLLINAGFSEEQATTLTDYGVCGKAGKLLYEVLDICRQSFSEVGALRGKNGYEIGFIFYHVAANLIGGIGLSLNYGLLTGSLMTLMINLAPYMTKVPAKLLDLLGEKVGVTLSQEHKNALLFFLELVREVPEFAQSVQIPSLTRSLLLESGENRSGTLDLGKGFEKLPKAVSLSSGGEQYNITSVYKSSQGRIMANTAKGDQFVVDLNEGTINCLTK